MNLERLNKQINFLVEIDKLKNVFRRSQIINQKRRENSSEHSWHIAIAAFILSEYSSDNNIDLFKVIRMLLIHDIVEIDAGDTFCYDESENRDKKKRERIAANRIFNILPEDQANEMLNLWQEFEDTKTPESLFANALDRFQALLLNYKSNGGTWKKYNIRKDSVIQRNKLINEGSSFLWKYAEELIDKFFTL